MNADRELLLKFIASLTLCDHMGDVGNEIEEVLRRTGYDVPEDRDWLTRVGDRLAEDGITTLNGTSLR